MPTFYIRKGKVKLSVCLPTRQGSDRRHTKRRRFSGRGMHCIHHLPKEEACWIVLLQPLLIKGKCSLCLLPWPSLLQCDSPRLPSPGVQALVGIPRPDGMLP